MLRLISLGMVAYSYFLIHASIPRLPRSIPTHFNAAGAPNGWGSPDTLWIMLGAQGLIMAIFLMVPYLGQVSPGAVHLGARRLTDFPPAQRAQMLSKLADMAAYLGIVMNLFFVFALREIIRVAAQPIPRIQMFWPMAFLMGTSLAVTMYYLWQFRSAAKDDGGEGPPNKITL